MAHQGAARRPPAQRQHQVQSSPVQVQTIVTAYFDEFVAVLTYLAVVACALSGALEARHRHFDVVGAVTAAFATAFGGGTVRDLLLGRTPIFWVLDPWLTVAVFATAVASYYAVRHVSDRVLLVPDALGLGLFTMLGPTYALQMKLSPLVAVLCVWGARRTRCAPGRPRGASPVQLAGGRAGAV